MIRPIKTLIEQAEEFDDTSELSNALREIEGNEVLSTATAYYLRECAIHMDALYSAYCEAIRALASHQKSCVNPNVADLTNI